MSDLGKQDRPGFCEEYVCRGQAKDEFIRQIAQQTSQHIFFRLTQAARGKDLFEEWNRLLTRYLVLDRGERPDWVMDVGGMFVSYDPNERTFSRHMQQNVPLFQQMAH